MAVRFDADRRVDERLRRLAARDPRLEVPVARRALTRPDDAGEGNDRLDGLDDDVVDDVTGDVTDDQAGDSPGADLVGALRRLPRIPGQRRPFGRSQLIVVAVLTGLGLLLAGWAVLRARPVALAAPIDEPTVTATSGAATSASSGAARGATSGVASAGSSASSSPSASANPSPAAFPSGTVGAGTTPAAAVIEVHVLGAVRRPGVVRLAPSARVADAIRAAGGLATHAQPGRLNLAQPLGDGQQLFIARGGHGHTELKDPAVAAPAAPGSAAGSDRTGSGAGSSGTAAGDSSGSGTAAMVNLNQASAADLDQLPGIGPVTAGKIIAWRTEHGWFSKVDELQEVDGIGPKTYADLAGRVVV